jgi:predicted nucleic acid-binding protein
MVSRDIATAAAHNYRTVRLRGITPRSTIDTIIATFCLLHGHDLLHDDRDFDAFEKHLGLQVVVT